MEISFGAKTDIGLKRSRNEDSLCADRQLALYVVCDGLGGRDAGDVASRLAVEIIRKHCEESRRNADLPIIGAYDVRFSPRTNRLASAIRLANQAIHRAARTHPHQAGMATTVVSAVITGPILSVAHVGDSRMYLIRGDTIHPLTADHSFVAEQVRRGAMSEEEAERSPQKHIVTRALGIDEAVDVDLDEVQLMSGDRLLLCSDGLTRGVKPTEIMEAVRREDDPQAGTERLVEMATAAGGEDNTTVILLAVRTEDGRGVWGWFKNWLAPSG